MTISSTALRAAHDDLPALRADTIVADPFLTTKPRSTPRCSAGDLTSTSIHARRQTIFDETHPANVIYQVVSGAAIVTRSCGDRRQVLEIIGPGGILGVVSGPQYGCKADTLTRTVLRRIDRSMADTSPTLQRLVGQALTRKLETLHDQANMRKRLSATECVAALIGSLPKVEGEVTRVDRAGRDFRIAVSQADIANYLGLAMETVCRAVRRLKSSGAILPIGREFIVVLDEKKLSEFAASGERAGTGA